MPHTKGQHQLAFKKGNARQARQKMTIGPFTCMQGLVAGRRLKAGENDLTLRHPDPGPLKIVMRFALLTGLVVSVLGLSRYPFDDAFIHLRLARNLAFHNSPYFNLNEPVMSGSSPLWMLLLAAEFRVLGRPSVHAAVVTECLVVTALFFFSEHFLAAGNNRSRFTLAAAFAVTVIALPSAGGLMETPLAITLLVAGLCAFQSDRLVSSGLLFGLAFATRFEMALPIIGVVALAPGRRSRFRLMTGVAPVVVMQGVLSEVFYRTVIPHAMAAKAIVYQMRRSDFLDMVPQELGKPTGAALVFVLAAATVVSIARLLQGQFGPLDLRRRAWLVLGGFPLMLMTIYCIQVPLIFPWYWTLNLCPMSLFICRVFQEGQPIVAVRRTPMATAIAIVAIVGLAGGALISVEAAFEGRLRRAPWVMENARTRTYLNIGRLLASQCPDSVVAAPEIGALGWAFNGKILDGDGLASPEVLPFHPLRVPDERPMGGVGSIPGRAIAALRPDIVVSMELFSTDFTRKAATLPALSDYALWWREPVFAADLPALPSILWSSRWTFVFSRHRVSRNVGCSA